MTPLRGRFLVIGGAEKCGTTSLFGYLASHPGARISLQKETDHFRSDHPDPAAYLACFGGPAAGDPVHVESSPAYLAEAGHVAPRIAAAVPQARLAFVLRDPVDRLRSSFRFYQSRLHVPAAMDFDRFVQTCLAWERDPQRAPTHGMKAWHLGAADRGRYERHLPAFEARFPPEQLLLLPYARLRDDVAGCTQALAAFAGLDPSHFDGFAFARENVSFRARHRGLQRVAVRVNDSLEGFWRRHPGVKRRLLALYKRLNAEPLQADALTPATQAALDDYYAPTRAFLDRRLGGG